MPTPLMGGLDGLIKLKDGWFVVSSWGGSAIYVLEKDGKYNVPAESLDAPAILGIDTKRNQLLIPLFKQTRWWSFHYRHKNRFHMIGFAGA